MGFGKSSDFAIVESEEMFLSADLVEMEKLEKEAEESRPPLKIVWRNIFTFSSAHIAALIGLYQFFFVAKWQTVFFAIFLHFAGAMGVTAGAHRLWSHRSFKATLPARIILCIMCTLAHQNDVIEWARDHRCHHKWTDTEADPHNSRRGFFYSHVGWLLTRKSEKLKEMGAKIDISDLWNDPVLAFQRRHYLPLATLVCFILPTFIPTYFWGETPLVAFYVAGVFRYIFTLNSTFLINSAAHMFGYKPYDSSITPVESVWTNIQAAGEGGHNFHHTFPQDYRASEFGYMTNWTRAMLDGMAYLGMVYDRKTVSIDVINRQKANRGDPDHAHHHRH
ncbi:fat-6 [Pristionchus pacificus]|uniref:Fat-7 n=1 Tax=Pristionchus pacificus TaxID=54126 RepID=A0A454Y3S3_PRIPA|nr:fat-6 [Pristionchus pacificus]|eukprot:PDM72628.1 fat-7 [Pristionchus pacificus]